MVRLCFLAAVALSWNLTEACKRIKIISNFNLSNPLDVEFFTQTLPWIANNAGLDLNINFLFLDSPSLSGPRKCTLESLKHNVWQQADYLRCDAYGFDSSDCQLLVSMDQRSFDSCMQKSVQALAKEAQKEYKKLKTDKRTTLIVLRGRFFAEYTDPKSALSIICSLMCGRNPDGCNNPASIDEIDTEATTDISSVMTTTTTVTTNSIITGSSSTNSTSTSSTATAPTIKASDKKQNN